MVSLIGHRYMLKFFFSKDSDIFPKQKLKPVLDKIFEQKLNELGKETFQKNFLEFQKKSGEIKPHENLMELMLTITLIAIYLNMNKSQNHLFPLFILFFISKETKAMLFF